jgi:hypothetical protein
LASGGFDIVLGNPPWERIKLQEQEFFAAREPEIANAANAAVRGKMIAKLKDAEPRTRGRALYEEFETAKRTAEASSVFARVPKEDSGRFPLTGRGDVNTYALFAELFATLAGPRGRAGVIVPTGIATDATTSPFFASLVSERRLFSLHDFQTGMGYFDRIGHARFKFCLLTMSSLGVGPETPEFSFFSRTMEEFTDQRRHFSMSRVAIGRMNPNTITAPVFRTTTDAELTAKIYGLVPVLIDDSKGAAGNPWGVSFMAMFHMANDSDLFRTAAQLAEAGFVRHGTDWTPQPGAAMTDRCVPLYEAKLANLFDHRASSYAGSSERGYRVLPPTSTNDHQHADFEIEPFYWISLERVSERLASRSWSRDWLLGWRDITHATNERTLIPTIIPRVGAGDSFLLLFPEARSVLCSALYGSLSSSVCDYCARQKLGGLHLKYFTFKQLPILAPSFYTPRDLAFIVPRILELSYTSHSMAPLAHDLGYDGPPFAWNEDRRALLRAELDAWYARAYGLTRDELRYILDPADVMGPDYPSETFRVLKNNEKARYGEYRTARLVLAAWDAQEAQAAAAK